LVEDSNIKSGNLNFILAYLSLYILKMSNVFKFNLIELHFFF
jgi:hypothetical protein